MSRLACVTGMALGLGVALVPAFERAAPAADCGDVPAVTWDGWAHGFFLNYCTSCHSASAPDRHGAPTGVDFDSESQVRDGLDAVRSTVFETHTMPVGGGIAEDDLVLLGIWLDCGAR